MVNYSISWKQNKKLEFPQLLIILGSLWTKNGSLENELKIVRCPWRFWFPFYRIVRVIYQPNKLNSILGFHALSRDAKDKLLSPWTKEITEIISSMASTWLISRQVKRMIGLSIMICTLYRFYSSVLLFRDVLFDLPRARSLGRGAAARYTWTAILWPCISFLLHQRLASSSM